MILNQDVAQEGMIAEQVKEALMLLGYLTEEPESMVVAIEAEKQYDELLAYVARLEHLTKYHLDIVPLEGWVSRPEWLHHAAVSVAQKEE